MSISDQLKIMNNRKGISLVFCSILHLCIHLCWGTSYIPDMGTVYTNWKPGKQRQIPKGEYNQGPDRRAWLELPALHPVLHSLWNSTDHFSYQDWNLLNSAKNLAFLQKQVINLDLYFNIQIMYYIVTMQPVCQNRSKQTRDLKGTAYFFLILLSKNFI